MLEVLDQESQYTRFPVRYIWLLRKRDIVRVDPFRTNVTQRQMSAAFGARFRFRFFWAVLSHFQLQTSIIWVIESIGSIRSMHRSIWDPLYQMTCLMRQMRHAFDASPLKGMRQMRDAFAA